MPDDELFPGGEPPDRAELITYLVHTVGLDHDDARAVADRYPDPSVGYGAGNITLETPERLRTWLDAQPEVRSASGPGGVGRVAGRQVGSAFQPETPLDRVDAEETDRVARAVAAADQATRRASGRRDRFFRAAAAVGFDSGPGVDAAALAQSMAVGVFTDAAGNPVIDPETGMPTEVNASTLWQAIKGETFDMGALAIPRAPTTRRRPRAGREGADDARLARINQVAEERRRFVTPSMAMALLGSMDDDDVIKLQQQLWEAGLFGDTPPSWGIADQATRTAYMELFGQASLTPDESIDRVLERLRDEAITRGTAGGSETNPLDVPAFEPEVASAESLNALIDDIASDLLGRFATPEEKTRLVGQLQAKELDTQKAQYDRDVEAATSGAGTGGAPGGIDAFMAAVSEQESGGDYTAQNPGGAYGKYQIMPANWPSWSERAGLGRNAPRTPENQEIVARHVMMEYYQRFGNWRDVAIAWFAGPGAVGAANAERRSDGSLTVREYADRAMARMAEIGGGSGAGTGAGQQFAPIETFDPAAEAEAALKASDPAGWMGHQFADRAVEFYQLMAGVA